jgi:hypothetical protein
MYHPSQVLATTTTGAAFTGMSAALAGCTALAPNMTADDKRRSCLMRMAHSPRMLAV